MNYRRKHSALMYHQRTVLALATATDYNGSAVLETALSMFRSM